jgi:hypothetical protein
MTKSEVYPMVATPSSIDAVIEQLSDAPSGPPPEEEPQFESVHGRPEAEATASPAPVVPRPQGARIAPAPAPEPAPEAVAEPAPEPARDPMAALAEIRGERDQERLRHQMAEQELGAQIESAKESTRRLEQRLSNVLAVTAEIRAACEKLLSAEPPS